MLRGLDIKECSASIVAAKPLKPNSHSNVVKLKALPSSIIFNALSVYVMNKIVSIHYSLIV